MVLGEILEKSGLGKKEAVVFDLWVKVANKVKRYLDKDYSGVVDKNIIGDMSKNLVRYACLVAEELKKEGNDKKKIEYEIDLLKYFIKVANKEWVKNNYEGFVWGLQNIDELVGKRLVEGIFGGRKVEVEAESNYIKKVADKLVDDRLKIAVEEGLVVSIGGFKKKFKTVEEALDFVYKYLTEIGYSGDEIIVKMAEIDIEKLGQSRNGDGNKESDNEVVFKVVDGLLEYLDKDVVSEIIEEATEMKFRGAGVEMMQKRYGLQDVESAGWVYNLYVACSKRVGEYRADEIFNRIFGVKKEGNESYLQNEEEGIIAIVDDLGRVKLKEKDSGVERGEEVYSSKEEAIAALGAKGYK